MAVVTIKNNDAMALGLWSVDRVYHVAKAMGGTITLVPDMQSMQVVELLRQIGVAEVTVSDVPVNTVEPTISGTAAVGETLTLDPGVWLDSTGLSYQWELAGVPVEEETGLTFVVPADSEAQWVTAVVTATNSAGSAVAETEQYGPVAG